MLRLENIDRRRALQLAGGTTAAILFGTNLQNSPEAEANAEILKDNYDTYCMGASFDSKTGATVVKLGANRRVAIIKPAKVGPNAKSLGQLHMEMVGPNLPPEFFPGAILPNPTRKSAMISSGDPGVGGGKRILIATPNFASFEEKTLDFPASHKANTFSADGSSILLQSANATSPKKRALVNLENGQITYFTPDSTNNYNSFSQLRSSNGIDTAYAGSAQGLYKVEFNHTKGTERTTKIALPFAQAGELKNLKNVMTKNGEVLMITHDESDFVYIVDPNDPTKLLSFKGVASQPSSFISGTSINKKNEDVYVAEYSANINHFGVEIIKPTNERRGFSEYQPGSGKPKRNMKGPSDVNVIYDEKDNDRAAVFVEAKNEHGTQIAAAIDGNDKLFVIVPLIDNNNEIPTTPTVIVPPTNTPVPTATATKAPTFTPSPTAIPVNKEVNIIDYSANKGILTAIIEQDGHRFVARNKGHLRDAIFSRLSEIPNTIHNIEVSPTNPNEIILTGKDEAAYRYLLAHSVNGGSTFYPTTDGPIVDGNYFLPIKPIISTDGKIALLPYFSTTGSHDSGLGTYYRTTLDQATLRIEPITMFAPSNDPIRVALHHLRPDGAQYLFYGTRWELADGMQKEFLKKLIFNPVTNNVIADTMATHPFDYAFVGAKPEANEYWALMNVNPVGEQQLTHVVLNNGYDEKHPSSALPRQNTFAPDRVKIDTDEKIAYDLVYLDQTTPRRIARMNLANQTPIGDVSITDELRTGLTAIISPSELRSTGTDRILGATKGVQKGDRFLNQLYLLNMTDPQPTWKPATLES